jgi:ubiquinone/menaquinone biosynthesis C-methylase UbiE
LVRSWRGKPNATTYREALQVFKLAALSKRDVFWDLGCGYGRVCIWAARRCMQSIGVESDKRRAAIAKRKVERRRLANVRIIKGDFQRVKFPDAHVVFYCSTQVGFDDFRRWKRSGRRSFRVVTSGPPPVPVKPVKRIGAFYLTKIPYVTAKTGAQWCHAVLGRRGTFKDVLVRLGRNFVEDTLRDYKRDFRKHFAVG